MRKKKITHEDRIAALKGHEQGAGDGRVSSQNRLELLDAILFGEEFSLPDEIRKRVVKKGTYSKPIERALDLYETMDQLRVLCEPTGRGYGPGCGVKLIDFDRMKEAEAFSSWKLAMRTIDSGRSKGTNRFSGLSLLSAEEITLYEKAKLHYSATGREKSTLQTLAARIMVDDGNDAYKEKGSAHRYVKALERKRFTDQDADRDRYIRRVNSFGKDRTTVREATAQAMREAMVHAALELAQTLPSRRDLIVAALPQLNLMTKEVREAGAAAMIAMTRSEVARAITDPRVQKLIAQSFASMREQGIMAVAALASLSSVATSPRKIRPRLKLLKSDRIM
jgi:hypothetical protein